LFSFLTFPSLQQTFLVALVLLALRPAVAEETLTDRGSYLARAADCVGCHTKSGDDLFAGGVRIETPFGYMLSSNITPDPETGIGLWSSEDFYRALHEGVNRHGQDMYPTMPYDFYTKITRADSDALYAYVRSVKPVHNQIEVNHLRFPFNLRWTMGAWRELYFQAGTYTPDPAKPSSWNRGAYLVEALGHCGGCHSPRNFMGGVEKSQELSGALIDNWFAVNLTSDITTGLGAWSANEIASYLKTGTTTDKDNAQGPMADFIEDSTSHLTDADRLAMAEYLKSIPPESRLQTGRVEPDPTKQIGARLYTDHCSGCHRPLGRGIPNVIPPLLGNQDVVAPDPSNVIHVIEQGIQSRDGARGMPEFGSRLTEQQVADIANYVRTSWGNNAPPNATSELVAKLRVEKSE